MGLLDTNLVGEPQHAPVPGDPSARVLVLGVGNLLMGDEGVGIHVIRELERQAPIPGARLLDGGTGGVDLLGHIQAAPIVVMVDATRDGSPAGTVRQFQARTPKALPQGLSAHDFGLKDLFAAAAVLGAMPEVHLITVAVETVRPMSMELSPEISATIAPVIERIRALAADLQKRGAGP
jgi:hydrogenase maturation protease